MTCFSVTPLRRCLKLTLLIVVAMLGSGCGSGASKPELPVQKAVVLPVSTLHKELRRDVGIVQSHLVEALDDAGYDCVVISVDEFARLQANAFDVSGSIYNPTVGEFVALDDAKYRASLLQQLRARGAFDVMIMPELTLRAARIKGNVISWDGVNRDLEVRGDGKYLTPREARGLSLLVSLYGNNGNMVGRGIGGIAVPFYLDVHTEVAKFQLRDAFYAPDEVSEGVGIAVNTFRRR